MELFLSSTNERKLNYLDLIPEDIAYLIFTHIDDKNELLNLSRYGAFRKLLISPYSYIRKISEKYPDIHPQILKTLNIYGDSIVPGEFSELLIQVYAQNYLSLKSKIYNSIYIMSSNFDMSKNVTIPTLLKGLIELGIVKMDEEWVKANYSNSRFVTIALRPWGPMLIIEYPINEMINIDTKTMINIYIKIF